MIIATSAPVSIYVLLAWILGLAGTIDVVLQPRRAFAAADESKLKWLAIELGGGILLLGPFTWTYYAVKVRRVLVQHGGRKPRKWSGYIAGNLYRAFGAGPGAARRRSGAGGGGAGGGGGFSASGAGGRAGGEATRIPCQNCSTRGGYYGPDPNNPLGSQIWITCPACAGRGYLS